MQRSLCFLLLILISAGLTDAQTKRRKGTRPPSRKEVISVSRPVPPPRAKELSKTLGLTIEKYASTHDVNADGTSIHVWEMQRRCSTQICLPMAEKLDYTYNADLQSIDVLEAGIVKPDGSRSPLPASAIRKKPTPHAEAATGFSSLHELKIVFDGLKIGESTYFKLKISTTKATFDNHFDALELFSLACDWKSIEINLTAPKGMALYTETPGLEGGRLADENGRTRWQWKKSGLTAIDIEPAMYDVNSISPRFAATTFKDHAQLGAAFWEHVRTKAVVTPEVKALAAEITKDISDPKQQAYAIYEWVNKNIRYLSLVLDRSGVIPHSTTEILANRYGDCKDYTTIIYALLKAKNIESVPLLIRAELGNWFPEVAAPSYFNHAVLYIPGLKLVADATAPNTRLGLIPQSLVGKKAVLSGEQTGILQISKDNPDENEILSAVEMEMLPGGSLKAVARNTYKGRSEMLFRQMFGSSAITNNSEMFVKVLLSYFGVNGTGRIRKIADPFRMGDPFSIEIETEIPGYTTFTPSGKFTLPLGINLTNSLMLEQFAQTETRKTDLIAGATRIREEFAIKFPATVTIEPLPAPIEFKNATGQYRNEITASDGIVRVTREVVIFKDTIAPSEYPQLRELIKKAVESHNIEIPYRADPSHLQARVREANRGRTVTRPVDPWSDIPMKSLSPIETARLETKLKTQPDDLETRRRLLRHYFSPDTRYSKKVTAARVAHRLWFIKNHPEMSQEAIYGFPVHVDDFAATDIGPLTSEWLAQVTARKRDLTVRKNAVAFFATNNNDEAAARLLTEGVVLHPGEYELAFDLSQLLYASFEKLPVDGPVSRRAELLSQILENGETALRLLKTERSEDRDQKRNSLLVNLARATFELGKLDRAKELATELILEFGKSESDDKFDDSSHIGNIVLGRIALRRGDSAKAKEHLFAALRAPLRQDYSSLSKIDTQLAKEFFDKGEKDIVLEYLRMCESLSNLKKYPESYFVELKSLKAWQEQIGQGKKPSFVFGNDAPLP